MTQALVNHKHFTGTCKNQPHKGVRSGPFSIMSWPTCSGCAFSGASKRVEAMRCAALPVPVSTAAHCLTGGGRGRGLRALGWHNARAKHVNIFAQRHG
jgi:hypothetical protein